MKIGVANGDQATTRSCHSDYLKERQYKCGHLVVMVNEDIDPRLSIKVYVGLGDDIEMVTLDPNQPVKALQVGKFLYNSILAELISLLANNLEVFFA